MRVMKSVGLIALGVVLGVLGSMASPRVGAQADPVMQPAAAFQPGQPVGTIITGDNIGFQLIAGKQGDVATGKLMIKVNGRWLPAAAPMGLIPAR